MGHSDNRKTRRERPKSTDDQKVAPSELRLKTAEEIATIGASNFSYPVIECPSKTEYFTVLLPVVFHCQHNAPVGYRTYAEDAIDSRSRRLIALETTGWNVTRVLAGQGTAFSRLSRIRDKRR